MPNVSNARLFAPVIGVGVYALILFLIGCFFIWRSRKNNKSAPHSTEEGEER